MVTRIYGHAPKRVYLREHRIAHKVDVPTMAQRLEIERESVYRIERRKAVSSARQAQYADILGISPEELWSPPRPQRAEVDAPKLASTRLAPEDMEALADKVADRLRSRG